MKLDYPPQYYGRLKTGACDSAKAVVPLVIDLLHPNSVVDVGCGTGGWLAEFKRRGVTDILGVDGPHVSVRQLEIVQDDFLAADLTQPLRLDRYFDLAISLEVAEHLDVHRSEQFVETLTDLAPVVLFSAAIPHQGGRHHVNEQWPAYWSEQFAAHDFVTLDPFRSVLWDRSDVDWWYAQNLMLYVRKDHVTRFPTLASAEHGFPTYVHPRNYLHHAWQNRVLHVAVDLATVTRLGDVVIVADEDQFGSFYLPGRIVRPIVERNGTYFGPPSDDAEAIAEVQRMIGEGAVYLAIGWPAFWWLKFYNKLTEHLDEHHFTVLKNEHVIMYRLQP
jgi:SAM-dependent methyltransferase